MPLFHPARKRATYPLRDQEIFSHRFRRTALGCIGVSLIFALPQVLPAGEKIVIENVLTGLVDQVEVPAREAGALMEILVREGEAVTQGQVLARIDHQLQKLQVQRAKLELAVAQREFDNQAPLELARKAVELERQAFAEQELKRSIAHRKAENPFKVNASIKQREVAKNELDRALQSRKEFKGSISDSEIDGRRLSFEHAELNASQTRFEQEIEALLAELEDAATQTRQLSVEQALLHVDDAAAKRDVAKLQVELKQNQVDTALEAFERREIRSPIEGTVVQIRRHLGEWVEPGEPCLRIVRLNRLRVEGFVSAQYATRLSPGASAVVTIRSDETRQETCRGVITFISPEIDPVNQEVRIWVEIDNEKLKFRPGMHGTLTLELSE